MPAQEDLKLWIPKLRRYAWALGGLSMHAERAADDLVQATLLRSLKLGFRAGGDELGVHLYRVMIELHRDIKNSKPAAEDYQRLQNGHCEADLLIWSQGQTRQEYRLEGSLPNQSSHGSGAFEEPAHAGPQRNRVLAALESLKPDEKEVYLLVVLEGFSYAQAARILRITQTAMLMRLMRARLALSATELGAAKANPRRSGHLYLVK